MRKIAKSTIEIEEFEMFFSISQDLLGITDGDGNFLKTNNSWQDILGYSSKELVKANLFEFLHSNDIDRTQSVIAKIKNSSSKTKLINQYRCKNGEYKYIEWYIYSKNNQLYIIGRDVSEYKLSEKNLKKAKERLELVIDGINDGIWDWDLETNNLYLSAKWKAQLGYNDDELVNKFETFENRIHPEDKQRVMDILNLYFEEKIEHYEVTFRMQHKDGNRHTGIAIDITERKKIEKKLQERDILFEKLSSQVPGVIYQYQYYPTGKSFFPFATENIRNVYEVSPGEVKKDASKVLSRVHPEDYDQVIESIRHSYETLNIWESDYRVILPKQGMRWLRGTAKPEKLSDGSVIWQGYISDITSKKAITKELKKAKKIAENASKAKSDFLANMSHEIRTPLNSIIGFSELMQGTRLDEVQFEYVDNINTSSLALLAIINDILDFSKIEAGKLEIEIIKTDIISLISEVINIVRHLAHKKQLELLLEIQANIPRYAMLDPTRLKQILINLMTNAVKFTKNGEVELKVEFLEKKKNFGEYIFSVRDTGIGIKKEDQNKLFKAFSQADTSTTRKYGGTGLGLIISDMLAQKMGSKLYFTSEFAKGTTFYFKIKSTIEKTSKKSIICMNKLKRLLIIDDNKNSARIIKEILLRWNIECDICDNGFDAIQTIENSEAFDIILCDYKMPYIDGCHTIEMIRENSAFSEDKTEFILMHSSFDNRDIHQLCQKIDIAHRLRKPIKEDDLLNCICSIYGPCNTARQVDVPTKNKNLNKNIIGKTIKVLVVEDMPVNMKLIKIIIKKLHPEFEIIEAVNGVEALDKYKRNSPDLILMDIQMPLIDGLEVTREIRLMENNTGKQTEIIALTAGAFKEEEEKCIAAGMNNFLTKPIDKNKIKIILDKLKSQKNIIRKLEHFNKAILFEKIDNDQELWYEFRNSLLDDIPKKLNSIKKLIEIERLKEIKQIAHNIKGVSLNMELEMFADIADELEKSVYPKNDITQVQIEFEKLKTEWEIIKSLL